LKLIFINHSSTTQSLTMSWTHRSTSEHNTWKEHQYLQ